MKWLKNGVEKNLYFMLLFLHHIFLLKVKVPLYSVCLNPNHEKINNNQQVKVEKMVVLVKTFDHYHDKFQFF